MSSLTKDDTTVTYDDTSVTKDDNTVTNEDTTQVIMMAQVMMKFLLTTLADITSDRYNPAITTTAHWSNSNSK